MKYYSASYYIGMHIHVSNRCISIVLYHYCVCQRFSACFDRKGFSLPKGISLFGYQEIFKDARIWIGYRNTMLYTTFGTFVNLLFTLPAAYVLSRKEFRARRFIMFFFVVTLFFNGGLIPTYLLMKGLHLTNTMGVFIFPFCVNVFYLIIARTFFEILYPRNCMRQQQ